LARADNNPRSPRRVLPSRDKNRQTGITINADATAITNLDEIKERNLKPNGGSGDPTIRGFVDRIDRRFIFSLVFEFSKKFSDDAK